MRKLIGGAILILVTAAGLSSCADLQAKDDILNGLLRLDETEGNFLSAWGHPSHTAAMSGDEVIRAGITGQSGLFLKANRVYEWWGYDSKQVSLVFLDHKLVAWKSSKSVDQLATPYFGTTTDSQ